MGQGDQPVLILWARALIWDNRESLLSNVINSHAFSLDLKDGDQKDVQSLYVMTVGFVVINIRWTKLGFFGRFHVVDNRITIL